MSADDSVWLPYGLSLLVTTLDVVALMLLSVSMRRSRRRVTGRDSRRLHVALWIAALLLGIGLLSSASELLVARTSALPPLLVSTAFVGRIGFLVAVIAMTAIAATGAFAGARPRVAWWLAAASGLLLLLEGWVSPAALVTKFQDPIVILVPLGLSITSTLLLIVAFCLGFPLGPTDADARASGQAPAPA